MFNRKETIKKSFQQAPIIFLVVFCIGAFLITVRINIFRYNNFDLGKFDLGNMAQMAWYTLYGGKFMWLTDLFGANVPRWAMSHVDPILVIFLPLFAAIPHPLTLALAQAAMVLFSSITVYKIAELHLRSKLAALFFGLAFTFYPAIGFLNAWTGYHGVTAAIPFMFLAFYVYERMYKADKYSVYGLSVFWLFLILTMMGKEQIPLYIVLYGMFIVLFRIPISLKISFFDLIRAKQFKKIYSSINVRVGSAMALVGSLWFIVAFFIIIPHYSSYRIEGFNNFALMLSIDPNSATNVDEDNYFLSRYEGFGDSYTDIVLGMLKNPRYLVSVLFGGDKSENLRQTLEPMGYTSLLYAPLFILALPDLLINYSTTAGGIGTSEIINHRISMIIPILFISSIYGVRYLSDTVIFLFSKSKKQKILSSYLPAALAFFVMYMNISTSFSYQNPVYIWFQQAVAKRINIGFFQEVQAKTDLETIKLSDIKIGDVLRLSELENKDRECAQKIISQIPDEASVSGPDYLGAHLSLRPTYAIFPALYKEADYVIVDVFAQKILRILDLDVTIVRDVVADVIKSEDYQQVFGCGNLFVFKNVGPHDKNRLLPLQERYEYTETSSIEIFKGLTIVDYMLPSVLKRDSNEQAYFTYVKRTQEGLDDYVLFMTFINKDNGEIYQVANLPSFSLKQLREWDKGMYYTENIELTIPSFVSPGEYLSFMGMTNNIRTRSVYLGDVVVK